jgi:hypothetical protein
VQQLNLLFSEEVRENKVIPVMVFLRGVQNERKISRKSAEFAFIVFPGNQEVLIFVIQFSEPQNQISNVGTDPEVIELSNVKSDPHLSYYRSTGLNGW